MIKAELTQRLGNPVNEIFKKAFLELQSSYLYVKRKLPNTSLHRCYETELQRYQDRFNKLSNQSS